MNNDKKTTLFGAIQYTCMAGLGWVSYTSGQDVTTAIQAVQSAGDWGALFMAGFIIFGVLKAIYTNKPDKPEEKK